MTCTPKATVDWLRFRAQAEPRDILEALRPMFGELGPLLAFADPSRGVLGFKHSLQVKAGGADIGRMDYGGESQRGWVRVDMPGGGCSWVQDWPAAQALEDLPSSEPRRVDLALTTWEGQINHDMVVDAHTAGRFTCGGRPPNLQRIEHSDPRRGRTCYVGDRKSDKFLRAYEKGYEIAGRSSIPQDMRDGTTHINGHPIEDIYRVEVELKATGSVVPWDVVHRPDQYFAGAYPFCADVLPGIEADVLQRRPERAAQRDLEAALLNVRTQYGATLFTALKAYHGDIGAVWEKVCGERDNPALVSAGVLLVDHE